MSQIIAVTSGKGGAGKSSVCTFLGRELAALGQRTLILEMDSGLRGLDLALGVSSRVVYDLGDVLFGRCEPIRAITPCEPGLWLLSASMDRGFQPEQTDLARLITGLSSYYDLILIDAPAGLGKGFETACMVADLMLIVVTPDAISVRDGRSASDAAERSGQSNMRLIINMVPEKLSKLCAYRDLDQVIDEVAVQLIGVLPLEPRLSQLISLGNPLPHSAKLKAAFHNIARRIVGEEVPLLPL